MRVALGVVGGVVAAYGGWLLVSREDQWTTVGWWIAAGIVAHDVLIAGATIALGALAVRSAPATARAPVAVGFIVLAPVTLAAIPVLGRFGARADNPTLLDRDYLAGWAVLAGLTVVAVAVAALVRSTARRRRSREGSGGADPRRR